MFSSNSIKFFFILALLCVSSCSYWRGNTDATPTPTPFVAAELKSEIPFATKEPDVYQTEIVITAANDLTERIFAARSGSSRLFIFDFEGKNETTFLQSTANQSFLISANRKVFAERTMNASASAESLENVLVGSLLNNQANKNFEQIGSENGLLKYRVTFGEPTNSEILIFFDEKINLPVRQEFYSVAGEQKTLVSSVELKNFSLQVDPKLFEIPKNFRKISIKEMNDGRKRAEK